MFRRALLPTIGLLLVCSLVISIGGCPLTTPSNNNTDKSQTRLVPFNSADELLSYFREQATHQTRRSYGFGLLGGIQLLAPTAAEDTNAGSMDDSNTGDSTDFSTTNVQEAGVDESDVFKSDGTYFYVARGQVLHIVKANPLSELAEVGSLDLGSRIDSLYLFGNTIITLSTMYGGYGDAMPETMIWPPYYGGSDVIIHQIDISDPANPTIVHQVQYDGSLVSSRLTNGRLILVYTVVPDLPASSSSLAISQMTIDEVLPQVQRGSSSPEPAVPWEGWLHPDSPDGYNMTAVVTLDASNIEQEVASLAVMANAGTIYASTEALYLTDSDYDPDENYRERTNIHKLAFDEAGAPQYVASGSVPGRLLNQFSLGEQNGYLRVATHITDFGAFLVDDVVTNGVGIAVATSGDDASPPPDTTDSNEAGPGAAPITDTNPPYNAVYVLGEDGEDLAVAGAVEGIAPNEQMYAARFVNERGYLVTFERIDPLFVLDLSDPTNPTVVGQLEIPGYSDYLHPLDATHLIGIGRSVYQASWGGVVPSALQLSLFDVSDPTSPALVQQLTVGGYGSYSDVSYSHKAFTLFSHGGETLLALPAQLYPVDYNPDQDFVYPGVSFDGVLCYSVDAAAGFTAVGQLAGVPENEWWTEWRRAAFIGDTLYAITPAGVSAAPLDDLAARESVTLSE